MARPVSLLVCMLWFANHEPMKVKQFETLALHNHEEANAADEQAIVKLPSRAPDRPLSSLRNCLALSSLCKVLGVKILCAKCFALGSLRKVLCAKNLSQCTLRKTLRPKHLRQVPCAKYFADYFTRRASREALCAKYLGLNTKSKVHWTGWRF